jgi:protein-disulfide isomerase
MACLMGAAVSAEFVRAHAGPWPGTTRTLGLIGRLCGENSDANSGCVAVLKSDWSAVDVTVPVVTNSLELTRRRVVVPVAFVGLAYFVILGAWFLFAGHPAAWGRWFLVPMVTVAAGAFGSAALIWILYTKLGSGCILCMLTHGINGLLLIATLTLWPKRRNRSQDARPAPRGAVVAGYDGVTLTTTAAFRITGFAVLVTIALWMYHGAKLETRAQVAKLLPYKEFVDQRKDDPAFLVREYYAEPQQATLLTTPGDDIGPVSAIPTVTIFTDFQCPRCACFAQKWKHDYLPRWQGPIRVSLRHLPLNQACNERMTSELHPNACEAGYAAEAARLQGGDRAFWEMHDLLFGSSRRLSTMPYQRLATEIGLDGEKLLADMEGEEVRRTVARDVALAAKLSVRGTPTVFLNRRRVPELCLHNPVFWEAIAAEFQRSAHAGALRHHVIAQETPERDNTVLATGIIDP